MAYSVVFLDNTKISICLSFLMLGFSAILQVAVNVTFVSVSGGVILPSSEITPGLLLFQATDTFPFIAVDGSVKFLRMRLGTLPSFTSGIVRAFPAAETTNASLTLEYTFQRYTPQESPVTVIYIRMDFVVISPIVI